MKRLYSVSKACYAPLEAPRNPSRTFGPATKYHLSMVPFISLQPIKAGTLERLVRLPATNYLITVRLIREPIKGLRFQTVAQRRTLYRQGPTALLRTLFSFREGL